MLAGRESWLVSWAEQVEVAMMERTPFWLAQDAQVSYRLYRRLWIAFVYVEAVG